jgi:hypothetical protein
MRRGEAANMTSAMQYHRLMLARVGGYIYFLE